jgi:L-ascorbate metabolism protein UlaG (beta-lactamase superfamily)
MAPFKAFGKNPWGEELEILRSSPQYRDGQFQNQSETPMMLGKRNFWKILWKFLNKPANTKPPLPIPSIRSDLRSLSGPRPVLFWFGHSSYLLRIKGRNLLVDPVFCGHASPFSFMVKSFAGSDAFAVSDMPYIDWLILTHDHYDHLDYKTVIALLPKIGSICTSLGVSSHLQFWGIKKERILELDWWAEAQIDHEISLMAAPARHFSGRSPDRCKTLWSSFILKTPKLRIYLGGDSGYDSHFKRIGEEHGPFDLAILECGQYNNAWPYIHMMPDQTVKAALDLKARSLLPVHWGKFSLALHAWNEPPRWARDSARESGLPILFPKIGEPVYFTDPLAEQESRGWFDF